MPIASTHINCVTEFMNRLWCKDFEKNWYCISLSSYICSQISARWGNTKSLSQSQQMKKLCNTLKLVIWKSYLATMLTCDPNEKCFACLFQPSTHYFATCWLALDVWATSEQVWRWSWVGAPCGKGLGWIRSGHKGPPSPLWSDCQTDTTKNIASPVNYVWELEISFYFRENFPMKFSDHVITIYLSPSSNTYRERGKPNCITETDSNLNIDICFPFEMFFAVTFSFFLYFTDWGYLNSNGKFDMSSFIFRLLWFLKQFISIRVFYNKTGLYLFSPHLHQTSFARSI